MAYLPLELLNYVFLLRISLQAIVWPSEASKLMEYNDPVV